MSIEAMKQMHEALFYLRSTARSRSSQLVEAICQADEAIEAGEKAIAEAEKQEPVGYADAIAFDEAMRVGKGCDVWPVKGDYEQRTGRKIRALYTHPQPKATPLDFGDFFEWANDNGYDTSHTHDGVKWICLNPMTDELWKAWQAAHANSLIHYESGMTADELWLSNGKLRAELADLKAAQPKAEQEPKREWVDLNDDEILSAPENLIACIAYVRNKLKEKNA